MIDTSYIQEILANARSAVEKGGRSDLKVIDEVLAKVATPDSVFQAWNAIDEQIGAADASQLSSVTALRDAFVTELKKAECTHIQEEFRKSPDAGWKAFIEVFAEGTAVFRHTLCRGICEVQTNDAQVNEQLAAFRQTCEVMDQGRWPEAYQGIEKLAANTSLPNLTRGRLLAILGQIQQFHFQKTAEARKLLDIAEELAPEDARVLGAVADYWLGEKNFKKVSEYCERGIRSGPGLANCYTTMGDYFESDSNFSEAEVWFRRSVDCARGDGFGYTRLLRLYGRPELFAEHKSKLPAIMERLIALCPEYTYQMYLECGATQQENGNLREARELYEKAKALEPDRPAAYISLGQWFEKQSRDTKQINEDALAAYKTAVEKAPLCPDGYWSLAWLYEQQEDWLGALQWYQKMPAERPEITGVARAKAGEMYAKLGDKRRAEEILFAELREDRDNATAKSVLHTIADDYYQHSGQREEAQRVLDEIRSIMGNDYESYYHNRLGNLHFYFAEYQEAAKEYDLATKAAEEWPKEVAASDASQKSLAVFLRNLGLANRNLGKYDEAIRQLTVAKEADRDENSFNKEMSLVYNTHANEFYGKADYDSAIKLYLKAITHNPADDVIHSNLAGALERAIEPGRRVKNLDAAINEYRLAYSHNADEKYLKNIERISTAKEFIRSFGERAIDRLLVVNPIAVEVAQDLIPFTEGASGGSSLSDDLTIRLAGMKSRIFNDFGLTLPGVRFRGNEGDLAPGTYVISLNEIPLVMGTTITGKHFVPGRAEQFERAGIDAKVSLDPAQGIEAAWIEADQVPKAQEAGLTAWTVIEYALRHLENVLRNNLKYFVGHEEVAQLVGGKVDKSASDRARGWLTAMTSICQALVTEKISVNSINDLWPALEKTTVQGANLQDAVELIRSYATVSAQLPGNVGDYSVLPLSSEFESAIEGCIYKPDSHGVLALEPEPCQSLLAAVRNAATADTPMLVVVENPAIRPFVKTLIELEFPNIPVMTRPELKKELPTLPPVELDEPIEKTSSEEFR